MKKVIIPTNLYDPLFKKLEKSYKSMNNCVRNDYILKSLAYHLHDEYGITPEELKPVEALMSCQEFYAEECKGLSKYPRRGMEEIGILDNYYGKAPEQDYSLWFSIYEYEELMLDIH